MKFIVGNKYSRDQIRHELGGEIQSCMPKYEGRIVAGCFIRKMNPDAPSEAQISNGPIVTQRAKLLSQQREPIPVFLKGKSLGDTKYIWEYQGCYICNELIDDKGMIHQAEEKSGRYREIAYLLRFMRISD
jgi:hypothetical protein